MTRGWLATVRLRSGAEDESKGCLCCQGDHWLRMWYCSIYSTHVQQSTAKPMEEINEVGGHAILKCFWYNSPWLFPTKNLCFVSYNEYREYMCAVLGSELSCAVACDLAKSVHSHLVITYEHLHLFLPIPLTNHLFMWLTEWIILLEPFKLHDDFCMSRICDSCAVWIFGINNDIWFDFEWQVMIRIAVLVFNNHNKLQGIW